MRRLWLVVALIALVVPSAAQAKGGGEVKKAARQHCKVLRADMGAEAFRSAFGAKHAMKRCVKSQRRLRKAARSACRAEGKRGRALKRCVRAKTESEAAPESFKNAVAECRAEQSEDPEGFAEEFGDGPNAFGKCVAEHSESDDDTSEDEPGEDDSADEPAGPDDA
jgi:hypothetical protein